MNQIYFTSDLLPTSAPGFTNGILKEKCYTERVKVPFDMRNGCFRRIFLIEDYIVEDNI